MVVHGLAILLMAVFIGGCASLGAGNLTMRGSKAEAIPPTKINSISAIPTGQSTYHYKIDIYPGLDDKFDPNPKLTLAEYNQISQLDWYCAKRVDELGGRFQVMLKQGVTYGILQGILGTAGAMIGFGSSIRPSEYLAYIGMTGLGGGLASGTITYDMMLNVAHGYCMTSQVYKADELEGKLKRITIVPLYTGNADLPSVSNAPAPTYSRAREEGFVPPPPLVR